MVRTVSLGLALLGSVSACSREERAGADTTDGRAAPSQTRDAAVRALPTRPNAPPEWPAPADTPPAGMACRDMTSAQCLLSAKCVLEAVPNGDPAYVCREATGPCEGHVAQFPALTFKADCEGRAGCRYVEARCFCPPAHTRVRSRSAVAVSCECGGGPPHQCVASAAER